MSKPTLRNCRSLPQRDCTSGAMCPSSIFRSRTACDRSRIWVRCGVALFVLRRWQCLFESLTVAGELEVLEMLAGLVANPAGAVAAPEPIAFVLCDGVQAVGGFGFNLEAIFPLGVVFQPAICADVDSKNNFVCHSFPPPLVYSGGLENVQLYVPMFSATYQSKVADNRGFRRRRTGSQAR